MKKEEIKEWFSKQVL